MTKRRTIGRLAKEAGVNVETIRFYERQGLLTQPHAEPGGRRYGDEALWRLRYIRIARGWGWKLSVIADLIAGAEASSNFCAAIRAAARARMAEIDREIEKLHGQRRDLEAFVTTCASKPDSERCPIFKRVNDVRTNGAPPGIRRTRKLKH